MSDGTDFVLKGTVAETLAQGLQRNGVTHIFGQSLPSALILAAEHLGIQQISYRTENAGGTMADGFARLSGWVGVVTAQNGPAATLLVPPLSEAMVASVPLVALVQDVPRPARDRNAFQEFDHFALFSSCAKWIRRLDDPARADDYLDMAFTAATSGRMGPAVLLLPKDILREPAQPAPHRRSLSLGRYPLDRPRPAADAVQAAAQLLAEAHNPVIVAGGGVHLSGATAALADLQTFAGLPVATTVMGKGAVSERDPLTIGVAGYASGPGAPGEHLVGMVEEADVLLLVGTRTNENGTDGWKLFAPDAAIIHLDANGIEIGRNHEAQVRLLGDARAGLEDLRAALAGMDLSLRRARAPEVTARIAQGRKQAEPAVTQRTASERSPMRPERVMAELSELVDEDTIVVADASYSSVWVANYLTAGRAGQRFLTPRGLAGLGWGLPLALGAKVAHPAKRVICVAGDGGFGHVWAELETAVRCGLPVTVIVLNNGILGYQKHAELFQFSAHTSAVYFAPVDHAAIARACGARGIKVETPAQLRTALREAVDSPVLTLLDVATSSDAYPPIRLWAGHEAEILA